MVTYQKIGLKYKKQNRWITRDQLEKELTPQQIYKLNKVGKCSVRSIKEEVKVCEKVKKLNISPTLKSKYKIDKGFQRGKKRLELWRKNPLGYYNFVTYFDSENELDQLILNDVKSQSEIKKHVSYTDEDI